MLSSGKKAPLLVWDIDDVLNNLMEIWLCRFAPEVFRNKTYAELTENPPCRIWNIPKEEYLNSLDCCRREKIYSLPPRPEMVAFFAQYGSLFRHAVLSAVPLEFMGNSAQWVLHWFGDWIQSCLFIPSFRANRKQKSVCFQNKAEALQALGTDAILIDDSPANVAGVLENGGKALLFPAPWNENRNLSIQNFLQEIREKNEDKSF